VRRWRLFRSRDGQWKDLRPEAANTEKAVAYARQLLFRHPGDPLASPMVLEHRAEAAGAVLDYLWALMATKAAAERRARPPPGAHPVHLTSEGGTAQARAHGLRCALGVTW
jgi:hypothetical protein